MTTLLVSAGLSFAAVAAFNAAVDPYGLFGSPEVAGFNAVKARPGAWLSDIKRARAKRVEPSAVILGNSRAEIGFDPQAPALRRRGLVVYNLAVPGIALANDIDLYLDIGRRSPPRLLVVGLDFLDFVPSYASGAAWSSVNQASRDRLLPFKALFTAQATRDAIDTVWIQRERYPAQMTDLGFNPLWDYQAIADQEGYYVLFRQRAEESAKSLYQKTLWARAAPERVDERQLEALRRLLRCVRGWNAEAHFVIYPYHAQLQMLLDQFGLWPLFEDFKRAIVAEAQQSGANVTVWDFSGMSEYTSQPIPRATDRKTHSPWYWEAGHFKKELGDIILARVLDSRPAPDDRSFGIRLDPAKLEEQLQLEHKQLRRFRANNESLNAEVRELVAGTRSLAGPQDGL